MKELPTCPVCDGEGGWERHCGPKHMECDGETHSWWDTCVNCEGTGSDRCERCDDAPVAQLVGEQAVCVFCAEDLTGAAGG